MKCLGIVVSFWLLGCSSPVSIPPAVESPTAQLPTVDASRGQQLPITAEAQVKGQTIQLEVPTTVEQQALGLMFRPALPDNRGMLFPIDPPRQVRFWMKNVPVGLDMVFIRDGKIAAIESNVPPCQGEPCPTYGPDIVVDRVIELRAGRADELGLEVGDRISIQFLDAPAQ